MRTVQQKSLLSVLFIAILFALSACQSESEDKNTAAPRASQRFPLYQGMRDIFQVYQRNKPRVVFGDSHVHLVDWNELLQCSDVAQRGISGDTIEGLRERIADEAGAQYEEIFVLIGSNDLASGDAETMRASYEALLHELTRTWPEASIHLISIPPVGRFFPSAELANERARQVNAALEATALSDPNISYIDLHSRLVDAAGMLAPDMTYDGLHLSAAAYRELQTLLARKSSEAEVR